MQTTKLFFMAALALTFAACSNDDNDIQNPAQPAKAEGITITAQLAPKTNGAATRAVEDKTTYIEAKWEANEHLAILYTKDGNQMADATITAVDGTTGEATITFTLTVVPDDNTACTIVYPLSAAKDDNSGVKDAATLLAAQDGTLNANLDVRVGAGTIQTTTPSLTVTTQPAAQFAIFKFTTQNASSTAINVKPLTVFIGSQQYVITPASATSTLYAALPAVTTAQTVVFLAVGSDSKNYVFSKEGVTFAASTYYQSELKMTEATTFNLGSITGDIIAQNGDVLTGTLNGSTQLYKISIADGAIVTLDGVTINGWNDGAMTAGLSNVAWAGLTCLGNATIILKDGSTNTVTGFYEDYPGIQAGPSGTTLTITGETAGTGTLTASSNSNNGYGAAGIGGAGYGSCGTITIANTVTKVTAEKGVDAPKSIGEGSYGSCGTVTIGGVVGAKTESPYTYQP